MKKVMGLAEVQYIYVLGIKENSHILKKFKHWILKIQIW
jgi:hypothetical protein